MQFALDQASITTTLPTGEARRRLVDVTLAWQAGERIGLLGRSGSGKTSLVRLLGGLEKPTRGRLRQTPGMRQVTVMLQRPEEHFQHDQVGKQINSYARVSGYREILSLMASVGLPEALVDWPPLRLSTGQQRLVAIACALASLATFIILDEPMAGLDAAGRSLVKKTLLRLKEQNSAGWLIVSHHPDDLLGLVERLWILDQGRLVYDGPLDTVPRSSLDVCMRGSRFSVFYHARTVESR